MPRSHSPETIGPYRALAALPDRGFGVEHLAAANDGSEGGVVVRVLVLEGVKPPLQKRLKQRLREAAGLRDPHLERVLALSDGAGPPVVATECVLGITLQELVDRARAPHPPELLAGVVAHAARGLHALHEHRDRRDGALGWVHGHLAPSNLLIAWNGRVVVTQIALGELAVARVGQKFKYFSPEQARAATLDRRSDVFSLGLVLYAALTKTHPFSTESLPDYMLSVLADVPRDPCELEPRLSRELANVVMRCLEREPERRFADASQLASALLACEGVPAAAEESNLSAVLAEHYPAEREAAQKLLEQAASRDRSLDAALGAPSSGRGGFRPLLVLIALAIGILIIVWAVIGRAASTC